MLHWVSTCVLVLVVFVAAPARPCNSTKGADKAGCFCCFLGPPSDVALALASWNEDGLRIEIETWFGPLAVLSAEPAPGDVVAIEPSSGDLVSVEEARVIVWHEGVGSNARWRATPFDDDERLTALTGCSVQVFDRSDTSVCDVAVDVNRLAGVMASLSAAPEDCFARVRRLGVPAPPEEDCGGIFGCGLGGRSDWGALVALSAAALLWRRRASSTTRHRARARRAA